MKRTLIATTIWLLAGAAAAAGVFWAFLSTPESNLFTLALSAILLLVLFAVVAVTINAAVLAWHRGGWFPGTMRPGTVGSAVRGLNAFVIPVLLIALAWAITGLVVAWVERRQGEISAFFIARAGWSDVTWLFTAVEWIAWWIRWVAAPMISLVWLRQALSGRWRPDWTVVRHGCSPLRLIVATAAFVLLIYLPWVYLVPWRPRWLPPDTVEVLFVSLKLGFCAVLAAVGAALMIRTAAIVPGEPPPPDAAPAVDKGEEPAGDAEISAPPATISAPPSPS